MLSASHEQANSAEVPSRAPRTRPVMLEIAIRPMRTSDAPHVAQILRATGWFEHMANETVERTESRIENHIALCHGQRGHSGYVAEVRNGNVVGYALVHWLPSLFLPSPEGYLSDLFVHDAFRGIGIGRKLLDVAVQEAKNRGCSRLSLITNRSRETYGRGYYRKAGWVEREGMACFVFTLDAR